MSDAALLPRRTGAASSSARQRAERHRLPRGARLAADAARPLLRGRRPSSTSATSSSRAASASAASRPSGRRAPTSSRAGCAPDEQARVDELADPTAALVVRADELRRLLDLHAAARPHAATGPTSRRRASTSCSSTPTFSFKVDCPSEFDCATDDECERARAARAADRLPRQGLRELPAADARPPVGARARLAGAQPGRRAGDARRAARLRGRLAQLLPGRGRDRGVPGHRAAARVGAAARAAGRLPRCTTARARAPGWRSRSGRRRRRSCRAGRWC